MPSNSLPEPWKSFFSEIDAAQSEEVELHCLGGFVMTVLYGLERATSDVDVLPIASKSAIESLIDLAGEGSRLHKKYKVYLVICESIPGAIGAILARLKWLCQRDSASAGSLMNSPMACLARLWRVSSEDDSALRGPSPQAQ